MTGPLISNDKILTFISKCLSSFLPWQTTFIKGRSVYNAIHHLSTILSSNCTTQGVLLNFKKAYNHISHSWLATVLNHLNFPPSLTSLITNLHTSASAQLIVNSCLSTPFNMSDLTIFSRALYQLS
ncbi:polyprotein [Acanthamoeba castellanii str. Neff]|uniref:Polyprotein n=1 Tax=Acanthamoeba castellanii (strain ATCC 30010 / Neff) TaxID=1257118 RepID=L8H1U7_ACACF|nr:polyprotein [Acanthamoeba castellanii str. Neff]ELR19210.1 polyprotein [Acanthamoeba castellanii str. Neff]